MKQSVLFGMVLCLSGATAADTMYSRLESLYQSGSVPESRNVFAESAWAGKCIGAGDPNHRMNSALFFHLDEDDVLGGVFTMIPLFNLYDSEMSYEKMKSIALWHLAQGKVTSHVEVEQTPAYRGQPATSTSWRASYKFKPGALQLNIKGFKAPKGPAFVAKSQWTEAGYHNDGHPVYCYFSENVRADGWTPEDEEEIVPAPAGAAVPRD